MGVTNITSPIRNFSHSWVLIHVGVSSHMCTVQTLEVGQVRQIHVEMSRCSDTRWGL